VKITFAWPSPRLFNEFTNWSDTASVVERTGKPFIVDFYPLIILLSYRLLAFSTSGCSPTLRADGHAAKG
jgi:hypothetical protein